MLIYFISVPRGAPSLHEYRFVAPYNTRIFWHPISEGDRGGVILGYTISYETECFHDENHPLRQYVAVNISAPSNNYTLTGLHPGLAYRIRISAFTSKGTSEHPNDMEVFTCECCIEFVDSRCSLHSNKCQQKKMVNQTGFQSPSYWCEIKTEDLNNSSR